MKKWLLLLGITLNFGGLYGMDPALQDAFQGHIEAKNWLGVVMFLSGNANNQRENLEKMLLKVPADELNTIVDGSRGLFEQLFMHSRTSDADQRRYWKGLLKKLIYRGLDFRVKKQDKFVYNHNTDGVFSQWRANDFWQLFDELVEENPGQGWEKGFESEIVARKEQQRIAHEEQANAVYNKKLIITGLYCALGCVVLAVVYQLYKRYAQAKIDDDEEELDDINQQEVQKA